jgi:tRNA(Ile2) C34 agmatinyltransferase TiaS
MTEEKNPNCKFCNPKKMDWSENGFYGYRCSSCQGNTAFIVSSTHRGTISDNEKQIVEDLCKKHYPKLKLKWISKNRKFMSHWYDFLTP